MQKETMRLWQTSSFQKVTLVRGQGCTVWDTTGKSYLDLLSGTWCNVLGHSHPDWVSAVQEQAAKLTHAGSAFIGSAVYAGLAKLEEILPPQLSRAVFLNTGSESVELALKMARAATGADGMVVIGQGYYGATSYALALSEVGRTAPYLPAFDHILRLPPPNCRCCPVGSAWPCTFPCLDPLAELAESRAKRIAAVIYEPVMGRGVIVPPLGYGARLRALSTRCQACLIAEEVTTGLGRTGRWFGFQHEDLVPDILVIGKAIGGGLPISAVVSTPELEANCRGALIHVQSHQNDPFSGHIAATVISILQNEYLVDRAAGQGKYLRAGLQTLRSPWIEDVRGRGAMVGVALRPERASQGAEVAQRLLEAGFIVDYQAATATFRLFPPFVILPQEIDAFLQAFGQVLSLMEKST